MGIFDRFQSKSKKAWEITAPVAGECVPLQEVSDPTFAQEMLGRGVAIRPTDGRVTAPSDGIVTTMFPTGHAVAMTTRDGIEILVHVGLDTVNLGGEGFTKYVEEGQQVKKGDLLIEADLQKIGEQYETITPVVICNTQDYEKVEGLTGKTVTAQDSVIRITV